METTNHWQSRKLTQTFLEETRCAIPAADLQFAIIDRIVRCWCDQPKRILDLGCGDGIMGRYLLNVYPNASGLFIDNSDPMIEAARASLRKTPNVTVSKADFSLPNWTTIAEEHTAHAPFDIVISGFAIHHLTNARKQELYGEIFALLGARGLFLNLEHVSSSTPAGTDLFDAFLIDHLHRFQQLSDPCVSREMTADSYTNRQDRHDNILAPMEEQCRWLRRIGFTDVDCFFKAFELAIIGGRRLTNPQPNDSVS